ARGVSLDDSCSSSASASIVCVARSACRPLQTPRCARGCEARSERRGRWTSALRTAVSQEQLVAKTAILQLHEFIGVRRFVAARTDVVDEPGRDALIAKPDELRERHHLPPDVLHI